MVGDGAEKVAPVPCAHADDADRARSTAVKRGSDQALDDGETARERRPGRITLMPVEPFTHSAASSRLRSHPRGGGWWRGQLLTTGACPLMRGRSASTQSQEAVR